MRLYGDAILRLFNDPALYQAKMDACRAVQEPFYDVRLGWGEALRKALLPLRVASRRWRQAGSFAPVPWTALARRQASANAARSTYDTKTPWATGDKLAAPASSVTRP